MNTKKSESEIINNSKLFAKIAKANQEEVVKAINCKKKSIKDMVIDKFGKVNLQRKPSALKLMEKGMKKVFFGRKGIVTKRVSKLEMELVKKEIKKQNNLENKIFIGSMPYLTIRDTAKETKKYKNNDAIKRQLMMSSNYTVVPKKPLFTSSNRFQRRDTSERSMTTTATNDKKLSLFQTVIDGSSGKNRGHSKNKGGISNKTFYKVNTKRVIKDYESNESPSYSQFKTSTCTSPIKNLKGIALNITTITNENNQIHSKDKNNNHFQPYLKASMIGNYNKTVNILPDENIALSQRSIRPKKNTTANLNFLTLLTQNLHSKINNLDHSSTNVENNLLNLIDSTRMKGSSPESTSLINPTQLETDYEMLFNRKMSQRRKTIESKASIQKKFNMASLMIDPIKDKMNQLQSRIHKLTNKQAESYADEITLRYLKNKNDTIYKDEEIDYANMPCRTQSKEVKDMKRRIFKNSNFIMRMRHNLLQENLKLINKFDAVNKNKNKKNSNRYQGKEIRTDGDFSMQ